jgi:predicted metal-dependent phosphoesterase TrpH
MRLVLLLLAACSRGELATPALRDAAHADSTSVVDERRWFAGDVHMHVAPPDDASDVTLSIHEIADAAKRAGMDFVVLTPHLWQSRWGTAFRAAWRELAGDAAAIASPTMIPGVEWGDRDGHFTVTGVDIAALRGASFLEAAHDAGAFISANHPFAVPTKIAGVRVSHFDLSYRPWSARKRGFTKIDGAEVWNVPLAFANVISRPGGRTGEARAWTELNRVVHDERRRVTAVGGTDNHKLHVAATTWVLAADATATAILEALARGATCIGGPEAGTLRAKGDSATWARIGETVIGRTIQLAWDGTARLFIDDEDRGEHVGGFSHETNGELHTYRIAIGGSRCGFIYANLM